MCRQYRDADKSCQLVDVLLNSIYSSSLFRKYRGGKILLFHENENTISFFEKLENVDFLVLYIVTNKWSTIK